ncbi:hypothetical protein [Dactylosporangium sp. CA-092794]|uniref:hypothetical protein n=1 Tax=Dactylosporangium sp. CA-092794 TaxID=3239929 RepID=UPI003D8C1978
MTTVARLRRRAGVRVSVALVALAVTAGAATLVANLAPTHEGFLTRRGDRLVLDGHNYRFAGQTVPGLVRCGHQGQGPDDAQLDTFFGGLPARSMVRTWATQTMRLADVERVVAAAKRHGQLLTLVLASGGADCPQPDNDVAPSGQQRPDAWYRGGYTESFLPWLRTVAARFRDEPAVGLWELISAPGSTASATELRKFYDVAGGELHRADPNHLVASGTQAPSVYGGAAEWRQLEESPGVDVATMLDYDMNAGPSPHLADALAQAEAVDKPLVLADVGVFASRDGDPGLAFDPGRTADTQCVTWAQRVSKLRSKLDASFTDGIAGADVRGWRPGQPAGGCSVGNTGSTEDPLLPFLRDYSPAGPPALAAAAAPASGSPAPSTGASVSAPPPSASPSVPPVTSVSPPGVSPTAPTVAATPGPPAANAALITQVGTATVIQEPGTEVSHVHQLPSGVRAGDQIIVAVELNEEYSFSVPAGYVHVATATSGQWEQPKTVVFRRTAQAGDTKVVVNFDGYTHHSSTVIVYRGVDPSAPVVAATTAFNDNSASITVPSLSAPSGGQLVLAVGVAANGTPGRWVGAPAGMSRRASAEGQQWHGLILFDQAVGAGATGSRTAVCDAGVAQSGVLLALRHG